MANFGLNSVSFFGAALLNGAVTLSVAPIAAPRLTSVPAPGSWTVALPHWPLPVTSMGAEKMTGEEIRAALAGIPEWTIDEGKLFREFVVPGFVEAFGFMASVAIVAEAENHHPEWLNVYKKVRIHLTTHEAGGISDKDFALARRIDEIYSRGEA